MFSRKLSEQSIQHVSEDSITLGDSVLIKVSGADDDAYKEVIVSWWFEVCNYLLVRDEIKLTEQREMSRTT